MCPLAQKPHKQQKALDFQRLFCMDSVTKALERSKPICYNGHIPVVSDEMSRKLPSEKEGTI